jgi:transcriptional regulator with XRE-family HTH domain
VHEGNQTRLARELGLSQPALWQILNGETRPSYGTAEALAAVEGVAVETLLAGPRERAAALAREAHVSEAAIARVLAEHDDGEIRPVLFYVDRMRHFEAIDAPAPMGVTRKAS